MGLMEAWLNAAVREGFEHGRSLAEIAEETGFSESDVPDREVELKLIPHFAASYPIRWQAARRRTDRSRRIFADFDGAWEVPSWPSRWRALRPRFGFAAEVDDGGLAL